MPNDIVRCHALIKQLRAELQVASERIEEMASLGLQDAAMRLEHLEALLAEHEETIADQHQTIKKLSADNALLKRSLFGPRRERFTDPAQILLFDAQTLEAASQPLTGQPADDESSKPDEGKKKKKRTSKGRQPRVFPEFLPREEEKIYLDDKDIPEAMRIIPMIALLIRPIVGAFERKHSSLATKGICCPTPMSAMSGLASFGRVY